MNLLEGWSDLLRLLLLTLVGFVAMIGYVILTVR